VVQGEAREAEKPSRLYSVPLAGERRDKPVSPHWSMLNDREARLLSGCTA